MTANPNQLLRAFSEAFAPPSSEPCWQWMERHVVLDNTAAIQGRWSSELVPQVRFFFDACQHPRSRRVTVMVSAQSTKTQNAINFLLWSVDQDPAPTMWIMASSDNCKEFLKKRIRPAIADCGPVSAKAPTDRGQDTRTLMQFDTMNLLLRGSNSRIGLQSDPIRRIICDERREWKRGAIDLVRKRLRTFHNSIEISMGTAGVENDELHRDWLNGSQTIIHFRCLKCQHSQPFRFGRKESALFPEARKRGGVVWDEGTIPEPGGSWDAFRASVRYECEGCGHRHEARDKFALLKTVHEHHRNPEALPEFPSFHWNALSMPWPSCDWAEIAIEFVKANAALAMGDIEPLKAFVTETLGEPWQEVRGQKAEESEVLQRCGQFELGEEWPDKATVKLVTVDVQKGYLVALCRQFKPTRESRMLHAQRLLDFDELAAFVQAKGLRDDLVFIDTAYGDQSAPEDDNKALDACWQHGKWVGQKWIGWNPMIGHKAAEFTQQIGGKTVKTHWKFELKTIGPGRVILRYQFSKPHYRERFFLRTLTGDGARYEIPRNVPVEWLKQVRNVERVKLTDPVSGVVEYEWRERGRHDFPDCEQMMEAGGDICGIKI